jgi:pyruvate kinase
VSATRSSSSDQPWDASVVDAAIRDLSVLRQDLLLLQTDLTESIAKVDPDHAAGARNLVHYVGLRRHDVRALQDRLSWLGLSSLGRAESHVLANVDKVLGLLHRLAGRPWTPLSSEEPAGIRTSSQLLEQHTCALLGDPPQHRTVRIMVTMGGEMASDYPLVRAMLKAGMDCARINCAHDEPAVWSAMVANVRRACDELKRSCRILFDLAGPKVRTGAISPGAVVMKWRPQRDEFGHVLTPARVRLRATDEVTSAHEYWMRVDPQWLAKLEKGDSVELIDARGARRVLTVCEAEGADRWAQSHQSAYVVPGTPLQLQRATGKGTHSGSETPVLAVAAGESVLHLHKGDVLLLTRRRSGAPPQRNASGRLARPASIPCTLPQVLTQVHAGERIWFDDGRIGGVIRHVEADEVSVQITVAREEGEKLAADKGINLPDSDIKLDAITEKDIEDLRFVAKHADMVGLSFVRRVSDIEALQSHLARLGAGDLGIVLKIENRIAFEQLPALLMSGLRSRRVGVMIARGDLAVEMGWERLAEVQEEFCGLPKPLMSPSSGPRKCWKRLPNAACPRAPRLPTRQWPSAQKP